MKRWVSFFAALWLALSPVGATQTPLTGAGMARTTPLVVSRATFADAAGGTTSRNATLPATINAGNLLVVAVLGASSVTFNTPAGYTLLSNQTSASGRRQAVYYKTATGSEGATVTITTSSTSVAVLSWTISPWNVVAPDFGTMSTGTGATCSNSIVTFTGGSRPTLVLAMCNASTSISSAPSGYSNFQSASTPVATSGSGEKTVTAVSETPGTFALGGSANNGGFAISVQGP